MQRPLIHGPGFYCPPPQQFNGALHPRLNIQPNLPVQQLHMYDLSPRPMVDLSPRLQAPQWEPQTQVVTVIRDQSPPPLHIVPMHRFPEPQQEIIFPLVPAQNLPVSEPKSTKPSARWGPKSPDKYIPRGPVGVSRWSVCSPTGIAYRNTPRFEDRDDELVVACGAVVQGLPVTGLDGGHYLRTREGRFLPLRDKGSDRIVLTKLDPDPFDTRMLQHFRSAQGRRQLALLPSEQRNLAAAQVDSNVRSTGSADRDKFEGF